MGLTTNLPVVFFTILLARITKSIVIKCRDDNSFLKCYDYDNNGDLKECKGCKSSTPKFKCGNDGD